MSSKQWTITIHHMARARTQLVCKLVYADDVDKMMKIVFSLFHTSTTVLHDSAQVYMSYLVQVPGSLYSNHCDAPVAKRNFNVRHSHGNLNSPPDPHLWPKMSQFLNLTAKKT
jgi:hypothetical protein